MDVNREKESRQKKVYIITEKRGIERGGKKLEGRANEAAHGKGGWCHGGPTTRRAVRGARWVGRPEGPVLFPEVGPIQKWSPAKKVVPGDQFGFVGGGQISNF